MKTEAIQTKEPRGKIFYIGLSRTGTTSLHEILEQLGLKSCHFCEGLLRSEWASIEKYDAVGDSPVPMLYQELDYKFPDSKFILTTRDKEKWLKSMEWMFHEGKFIWNWSEEIHQYHEAFYKTRDFDREILSERWDLYHEQVNTYFSDRPDDLLTIRLEDGFDTQQICEHIDVQYCEVTLKKSNTQRSASFQQRMKYWYSRLMRR